MTGARRGPGHRAAQWSPWRPDSWTEFVAAIFFHDFGCAGFGAAPERADGLPDAGAAAG
ncbi:hypothetical protein GTW71_36050, partial [Streptomyces sp. SID6041]|nr:hypothetical protein [Streptomyces sp. SID6041]